MRRTEWFFCSEEVHWKRVQFLPAWLLLFSFLNCVIGEESQFLMNIFVHFWVYLLVMELTGRDDKAAAIGGRKSMKLNVKKIAYDLTSLCDIHPSIMNRDGQFVKVNVTHSITSSYLPCLLYLLINCSQICASQWIELERKLIELGPGKYSSWGCSRAGVEHNS